MRSDDLPLSRAVVDRDGLRRLDQGVIEEAMAQPTTRILHLIDGDVLTGSDAALMLTAPVGTDAPVPTSGTGPDDLLVYLGRDEQGAYLAQIHPGATGVGEVPDGAARRTDDPQGAPGVHRWHLRDIGAHLSARDAGLATGAVALANWHSTHRFCPRCGGPTEVTEAGWVRRCTVDGSQHFPRTDPAVIMAITDRTDRLLLGHGAAWPAHRFSVPAGFVEPGESLEAAVRREVAEETGVRVGQVTYQASQPWPFPASLMVGCTGRALTTEVQPDGVEVTAAMFLTRTELTEAVRAGEILLPRATSIAHYLIAQWYGGPLPGKEST